jgi:hypothetical protein
MRLEITSLNPLLGYVSVVDWDTHKEYFTQGEQGQKDIDFIDWQGEEAFLDLLASSGYFDRE